MEWANEIIIRLRELWSEGHSTAEIGRRLGVSKNSIVGKAHRLDLPARPSPIRREGERPPPRSGPQRRLAGPTLPPLSSTSLGTVPLGGTSLSSPPPVAMPSGGMSPVGMSPVGGSLASASLVPVQPSAALPPRPRVVIAARPAPSPPRTVPPQAPPPRPYGRVITCCWPIGEPGTRSFRFCDAESVPGKPYCSDHAQLAYVKVRDRREDAA
ncbi:MAG TPA: GcrA family cell cycle regulator [Acetobacteraceae bacterium]|nr:GcrA family cell cycle regulator [Acetobacteraceae bacterium]